MVHVMYVLFVLFVVSEKGLASKMTGDNKQFWKNVRLKTKTVTKVSRLKGKDATLTSNNSETANVLNNNFCKCI